MFDIKNTIKESLKTTKQNVGFDGVEKIANIENIKLSNDGKTVIIIDQTKLPNEIEYIGLSKPEHFYDAIKRLQVRGAPAIGICAGYGMSVIAKLIADSMGLLATDYVHFDETTSKKFLTNYRKKADYLISSRPTAVNLSHMVERLYKRANLILKNDSVKVMDLLEELQNEAIAIHQEDMNMCRTIAEYGLSLIRRNDGILTHCNAGPLATSKYGTALGPLILGKEKGIDFHVYADETRPLLQGARLTTFELQKAGIDVTLICDNMASMVMKNGWVQACFVGCDRVAANGDTANKIGTSGVAILAKYYGIPFYVLGPSSSIDMNCATGADIVIEERDPEEIKNMYFSKPSALKEVKCFNPSFDVTDHELITAIVTEKGIITPPFAENMREIFK